MDYKSQQETPTMELKSPRMQGSLKIGDIHIHARDYANKPWIYQNESEGSALSDAQIDKLEKILKRFFAKEM